MILCADILTFRYCIHCNVYIACYFCKTTWQIQYLFVCRACAYKECADNVTISPFQSCVQENTTLNCSTAGGHPGSPSYSWTHTRLDTGPTATHNQTSYMVPGIGFHQLQCTATYTQDYCPQYYAECHANISLETFSQYLSINVKFCYS